ncbi:MAG: AAA family ATPase [Streptosporangiales bacterium]|nr:AAA family ATPase [Streptosporangiales bacterium]
MSSEVFSAFCSAGLWPSLGRTLAERLPAAGIVGPEQVSVDRLTEIESVGRKRAERLVGNFEGARPAYEVVELLVPAGAPARLAAGAVEHLGETAAKELREDPWRLLLLPEVRPDQADGFARRLLGAEATPTDPRRGRALVAHLLSRAARDGHTAVSAATVTSALSGFDIAEPREAIEAALDEARVMAFVSPDPDGSDEEPAGLLALARYALAEETVADGLRRLDATAESLYDEDDTTASAESADVPADVPDDELDEAQRAAVRSVAEHGVSVLTGGPGTGKSRTIAAVVELARRHGKLIALAAPTGRAAKRLEELADAPATTLHRLLGAQGTTGEFARGEEWPLDADIVVVDETSMLDAELAAALLEACVDGTHLLLVGDPAQLPSIGAGRVLADVMASGTVRVTELRTLYRQREGGTIARLATAVRGGELPQVDSPEREVVVVPARGGADAARRVVQLVTDSIPRALGIAPDETQVVTPVHRGEAGTIALNRALKAKLNPGPGEQGGFDVGDRVVAVANHVDHGFANGEVGVVTGVEDGGALVVTFASGPATVPPGLLADLRHGWAITVHRAQGSEWPAVVAVLPGEAAGMLSRPLVYTAFTRAQRHLSVVHAAGPALARAVRTVGERPRRTRLVEILQD